MDGLTLANTDVKKDPAHYYFEISLDRKGQYRWHLRSSNGNIIADSGQGYTTKKSCENGIKIIQTVSAITSINHIGKNF